MSSGTKADLYKKANAYMLKMHKRLKSGCTSIAAAPTFNEAQTQREATYDYEKIFVLEKLLVSTEVEPDPKCDKFICSVYKTDDDYKVYQKAKETERKTLYQQPEWHVMSVPDGDIAFFRCG